MLRESTRPSSIGFLVLQSRDLQFLWRKAQALGLCNLLTIPTTQSTTKLARPLFCSLTSFHRSCPQKFAHRTHFHTPTPSFYPQQHSDIATPPGWLPRRKRAVQTHLPSQQKLQRLPNHLRKSLSLQNLPRLHRCQQQQCHSFLPLQATIYRSSLIRLISCSKTASHRRW